MQVSTHLKTDLICLLAIVVLYNNRVNRVDVVINPISFTLYSGSHEFSTLLIITELIQCNYTSEQRNGCKIYAQI